MAALTRAILVLVLCHPVPARADPIARWSPLIDEASARFNIPGDWIANVMRAESGGRTSRAGQPIVSHAGAMGLMQLMPGTWREMRIVHGLGMDPHDPRDNVLAGTAYLRLMFDRFGYPGLFSAYNAGPARYAMALRSGRTLPAETRDYVTQVTGRPRARATVSTLPINEGKNPFAIVRPRSKTRLTDAPESRPVAPALFFVRY